VYHKSEYEHNGQKLEVIELASTKGKVESVFTAYMRCEGRITVPKEIRDAYKIREGDLVECNIKKIE
jgi:AbrB family looped-hinge helix DNA binding protein